MQISDVDDDVYQQKQSMHNSAAAAGRGVGRKRSILAINDPHAVFDALQATSNLQAVSL